MMGFIWGGALIVLGFAVYHDLRERRIPNKLVLLALVLFPALVIWHYGATVDTLVAHGVSGLVVFSVGLVFWLTGWMGAGDVKLLGVLGLLFPVQQSGILLINVALAGLVLAGVVWPLLRTLLHFLQRQSRVLDVDQQAGTASTESDGAEVVKAKGGLPYAIAIAAGGIATLMDVSPLPS